MKLEGGRGKSTSLYYLVASLIRATCMLRMIYGCDFDIVAPSYIRSLICNIKPSDATAIHHQSMTFFFLNPRPSSFLVSVYIFFVTCFLKIASRRPDR